MTGSNPSGRQPRQRPGQRPSSSLSSSMNQRSQRRTPGTRPSKRTGQPPFLSPEQRMMQRRTQRRQQRQSMPIDGQQPLLPDDSSLSPSPQRQPSNSRSIPPAQRRPPLPSWGQSAPPNPPTRSYPPGPRRGDPRVTDRPRGNPVNNRQTSRPSQPPPRPLSLPPSHQALPPSSAPRFPSAGMPSSMPTRDIPARDMPLGPELRRHPQLSSNPAFDRPRRRQRPTPHHNGSIQFQPNAVQASALSPTSTTGLRANPGAVALPRRKTRTQSLQPHPVNAHPAHRNGAIAPLSEGKVVPRRRSRRPETRPVSPMVYAVRLLILGVGLGAITGTIISALDPSSIPGSLRFSDRSATTAVDQNGATTESAALNATASPNSNSSALSPDGASTATPNGEPTASRGQLYASLVKELDTLATAQPDLLPGVFALDLDTYNYVNLNGAGSFPAASTIKVPILIAFLQDVEQRKISLDEVLTMEEDDVAGGSGDMRLGTIGDQYTAIETATKMIVISDNTATNMLIRRMGGAALLNQRFRSWGLTLTQISNWLPDLEGTNTTSPAELTQLMAMVSQGKLINLRSRDRMLDIMTRTETATLLPAGIGGNAAIAHKTGDIGRMVGDTGLVDIPSGKRYAVTIMMQRPHNDNRAQELIRQMAGTIHRGIQEPPRPLSPTPSSSTTVPEATPSGDPSSASSTEPSPSGN